MKWLKQNWWKLLLFSLAVACDAGMDHYNFHVPHDQGFWSLTTEGWRFDIWHVLKVIKWTFIAIGMSGRWFFKYPVLITYAVLNYFIHELLFHKILRRSE